MSCEKNGVGVITTGQDISIFVFTFVCVCVAVGRRITTLVDWA